MIRPTVPMTTLRSSGCTARHSRRRVRNLLRSPGAAATRPKLQQQEAPDAGEAEGRPEPIPRRGYGAEFFQEIGANGGRTVSERYSNEHFREIGRKGGRRVAELIARAKGMDDGAGSQNSE